MGGSLLLQNAIKGSTTTLPLFSWKYVHTFPCTPAANFISTQNSASWPVRPRLHYDYAITDPAPDKMKWCNLGVLSCPLLFKLISGETHTVKYIGFCMELHWDYKFFLHGKVCNFFIVSIYLFLPQKKNCTYIFFLLFRLKVKSFRKWNIMSEWEKAIQSNLNQPNNNLLFSYYKGIRTPTSLCKLP